MAVLNNNALAGASGKAAATAGRSVRFNSADSAYLSRTPASAGNRRTSTLSFWTKKVTIGGGDRFIFSTSGDDVIRFNSDNKLRFYLAGTGAADLESTQLFRDPSAWYHFVFAFDTTQGTASDRIKVYLNGVQITAWGTATYPSQNYDMSIGNSVAHYFGRDSANANHYNGYLALVHYVNGQALTPSSFGETSATTGQWIAKTYGGTYGTNGFFLDFSDNSAATATTLGKDNSGNGNNWTPNNFSVASGSGNDSLVDTPTSVSATDTGIGGEIRGNYCTLNPLDNGGGLTLTNGNLDASNSASSHNGARATIQLPSSGKWYFEGTIETLSGGANAVGVSTSASSNPGLSASGTYFIDVDTTSIYKFKDGSNLATLTGIGSPAVGSVLQIAYDASAQKLWIGHNNNWASSGNPAAGTNEAFSSVSGVFPTVAEYGSSKININFGQRAFAYTAPSGFKALCDTNLPSPVVAKPNTVMDVVLYTGNGSTKTISGLGFSPNFIWFKQRNTTRENHLYDSVRGVQKALYTDLANAEATDTDALSSFNSDGWTMGADGGSNQNGGSYVAWCWDESVSAGFDIVAFTATRSGSTWSGGSKVVPHSLGVKPGFIVWKTRSTTSPWECWHTSLGDYKAILLNSTAAAYTEASLYCVPTSSNFTLQGNSAGIIPDGTTADFIAYVWAPVAGYSSFGSYTGNGSSDGPFVFCNFRPRWVLLKASSTTGAWILYDTARDTYNYARNRLFPSSSSAESSGANYIDILSNGFKHRDSDPWTNQNGDTYIYAAFAENPFQYARAR